MKQYFTNCFVAALMATQALAMAGADVVSEGIHYTTNDAEKTAYATYALFPTIRTGAPMLGYSVKSPHPICYYDESENYTNIRALVVPEAVGECTVTKIGDYAFNNSGVTSVEIGKNVTTLGDGAFIWNTKLTTVKWAGNLTEIGDFVFRRCTQLSNMAFPNSVKKVGGLCFSECDNLTEFSTGAGLENISPLMFEACRKLATINIGASVSDISANAFSGCDALRNINIDAANTHFAFSNGFLTNNDSKSLIFFTNGKDTCQIPEGIEKVASFSLCYNDDLRCLVIPASVSAFGYYSVSECPNLVAIHCKSAVPAEIAETDKVFTKVASHCTLYVPKGSLESYKAAPVWKEFANIKEELVSGVTDICASEKASDTNVYTIDGRIVKQNATTTGDLPQGIYIHKGKVVRK